MSQVRSKVEDESDLRPASKRQVECTRGLRFASLNGRLRKRDEPARYGTSPPGGVCGGRQTRQSSIA